MISNHIVFLGESTFPVGLAAVQRMTLMGKALIHAGCIVTVVCKKGGIRGRLENEIPTSGIFEGINYVYTSGTIYRPDGFVKRNFQKIRGMIAEFRYLARLKKDNNLTAAIISNHYIHHLLLYKLYSKILGFPIVLNFVEMASAMKGREKFNVRINDILFDKYLVKIVDGALPISNKLMDYYQFMSPKKPSLKLPILCDFNKFPEISRTDKGVVFLYCGAASYFELVDFVIQSFDYLNFTHNNISLKLVLGGKEGQLNKIKERIASAQKKDHIQLLTNIPHKDIPGLYSQASALLIPLRPTVQDEARFPHKIGEYLASGRPVITSAFGEINHYDFIDGETALIANKYEVDAFADKMKFILDNPEKSKEIGKKGRQMGLNNFDYTQHGDRLLKYFNGLISKSD